MPSTTYNLVREALVARESITAMYDSYRRDLTPHVIGLAKDGSEQALFFQFGGGSASGLPVGGMWRCLALSKLSQVAVNSDAGWHVGASKGVRPQSCVTTVDVSSED